MKQILILGILLLSTTATAQFEKGNVRVGGSTSQASMRFEGENYGNKVSKTDASFGYFVLDNLSIGMMASVYSEYVPGFTGYVPVAQFQLSPEVRYNFSNRMIVGAFYPFSFDDGLAWKTVNFQVGYSAFVSEKWAFEPMLYYTHQQPNQQSVNTVGLQLGISIY